MGSEAKYVHDVDTILNTLRKRFRAEYMQDVFSAKWFRSLILNAMNDTKVIHENNIKENMYDRDALKPPYAILYQFLLSVILEKSKKFIVTLITIYFIPGLIGFLN